jgi:hypothetical protein
MTEQASAPTERQKRIQARKDRIAALIPKVERVRVNPASDDIRRAIRHPSGPRFPESGSVEWPLDTFTKRRIAEGSVTRDEERRDERRSRVTAPKAE